MRALPLAWVGALGGALGRGLAPGLYPALDANARRTLALLRPDLPLEPALAATWDNLARTFCEIPGARRLWDAGRIEVVGAEHVIASPRPVLLAGLHTGNPELLGLTLARIGARPIGVATPQPSARRQREVDRLRAGFGGRVLVADRGAVRPAVRSLNQRDGTLLFWMDDYLGGVVHGPSLGRGPRTTGNIPYAVRLARLTGCAIVPGFVTRLPGAHFRTTFLPPVALPASTGDREADLTVGAAALDAVLDPIVRALLPQWFFTISWRPDR